MRTIRGAEQLFCVPEPYTALIVEKVLEYLATQGFSCFGCSKMLKLLQGAITLLRTKRKHGEELYWVLHYTYLSPQKPDNADEIIAQLQPHMQHVSCQTYYRRRKVAVHTLSTLLWDYSTRDRA